MTQKYLHIALNVQEITSDTKRVRLVPIGAVSGRDGRQWINDNPEQVVHQTQALNKGVDIVVDVEHASEHKAPKGDPAPAVGWIKPTSLQIEDGHITGEIIWNESDNPVARREYRYLSPVFLFDKETNAIIALKSVGLTNNPNLIMGALNQQSPESSDMTLKEILQALGLAEDAQATDAIAAINQLKDDKTRAQTALNAAQTPSLDQYVPRADYNTALNRAETAEQKLIQIEQQKQQEKIDTAINAALEAGKISPASVEYHKAACQQEGGLERFNNYVKDAPKIVSDSDLGSRVPDDTGTALNADEKKVAELMGISTEDFGKAKGA